MISPYFEEEWQVFGATLLSVADKKEQQVLQYISVSMTPDGSYAMKVKASDSVPCYFCVEMIGELFVTICDSLCCDAMMMWSLTSSDVGLTY